MDGHTKIADEARVIILAPYASVGTWDAIHGVFSSDIAVLNGALEWAFQRWTIDPAKIGMSGVLGWRYVLARHRTSEW